MQALKVATIGMGVLIVVGTVVLIALLAGRIAGPSAVAATTRLDEPAGTRITGIAAMRDRLALTLSGGGADRVVLVDPGSGRTVGRIELAR